MASLHVDRPAQNYRRDFADFSPIVYLNCAYQGPFPRATVARIHESCDLKCRPDRLGEPDYFDLPERVRARLARLVGADCEEIALTNSATQGIGIAAAGLDLVARLKVESGSRNADTLRRGRGLERQLPLESVHMASFAPAGRAGLSA